MCLKTRVSVNLHRNGREVHCVLAIECRLKRGQEKQTKQQSSQLDCVLSRVAAKFHRNGRGVHSVDAID